MGELDERCGDNDKEPFNSTFCDENQKSTSDDQCLTAAVTNLHITPGIVLDGQELPKYEIASLLARRYEYTSYLEICTSATGGTFSLVDKGLFSRRVRLMYRCPPGFSDGEPIDYFTEAESSEELFGELMRSGERFDLVFVDPWHTYASSLRDIVFGLQLIKSDGALLIHDCNPPNSVCAEPEYRPQEWCGVTYAAYLDVALYTAGIHYITVDSDYGCGVISKNPRLKYLSTALSDDVLASQWRKLVMSQKYQFFNENRFRLLRLVSANDFRHRLFGESPTKTG